MQNGSLQAERYVNFTIQDIGYLLKVTKMLKRMSAKVAQPDDIKNFFKGRYSSYKSFGDLMLQQYFFKVRIEEKKTLNISSCFWIDWRCFILHRVSLPFSKLQLWGSIFHCTETWWTMKSRCTLLWVFCPALDSGFGWLIISAFLQPMPTTLGRWGTWTVILRNTTKLCWISISTQLRKWRRLMLYSALRCRTSMISSSHLEREVLQITYCLSNSILQIIEVFF